MKQLTKLLLLPFVFGTLLSCGEGAPRPNQNIEREEVTIADLEIEKDSLFLNGNEGNWYYKDQLFNGYAVKYHKNGELWQKVGFFKGKKMGVAKIWFQNGVLKVESHYHKNKLVGSYKAWWENGVLASESFYENGKLQGTEKKWYTTGTLAKLRNLVDGNEQGLQQAWLQNGTLYVNYEAKNGRIFGMRRANLCYQLEDEQVVYSENEKP